jgi:cbb3-type cytochrome oxidase cytochrome c subunit
VSAPLLGLLILACFALAGCGSSAREALDIEPHFPIDAWQRRERLPDAALPGARIFAASGCLACHTYLGSGSRNVGAGDLSAVGRRRRPAFFERFVANPSRYGNEVMPSFAALGPRRLRRLAFFLAASRGPR